MLISSGVLLLVNDFKKYLAEKINIFEDIIRGESSAEIQEFIMNKMEVIDKKSHDKWEELVNVYLWAHYDDISSEKKFLKGFKAVGLNLEALSPQNLYSYLIKMIPNKVNSEFPAIDIGCSVGRLTHELAKKYHFAIGIDYSFNAIRTAREITYSGGKYDYQVTLEGDIKEKRTLDATSIIRSNVEFFVSDATNLPFHTNCSETVIAANMLDVVPFPFLFLSETNRILKENGYFITCDPYNWIRVSNSSPENWIGGKNNGLYAGNSSIVLRNILEKEFGFEIKKEKDLIPWTLRYDQRYMSIWLVHCLKAVKKSA